MSVPNTFATATSPIPLASLDANFAYYDAAFSIVSTALSFIANPTLSAGTANGVTYLNGSKVLTSGSALTFDGTNLSSTGGATFQGGPTGFGGGEVRLGTTASGQLSAISTLSVDSPVLFFDHRGSSNTGVFVWRNGTTGSNELARLTSTGLGIGTSSPLDKLEASKSTSGGLGAVIVATNPAASATGNAASIGFRGNSNFLAAGFYSARIAAEETSANKFATVFYRYTGITASGDESMRLDASGNLGLGVTPSAWKSDWNALDVETGGIALAGSLAAGAVTTNAFLNSSTQWVYKSSFAASMYRQISTGAHEWHIAPSGTAGNAITFTQAMTLDAAGALLVGTTSKVSSESLQVYGDFSILRNGSFTGYLGSGSTLVSGAGATDLAVRSDGAIAFAAGGATERARITSAGDLLVGTTSSGGAGGMSVFPLGGGAGTSAIQVFNKTNTTSDSAILFRVAGATVSGISYTSTVVTYGTVSDHRLKEVVQPITGALARNALLNPVKYKWKVDGSDGEGFIAHELQGAFPTAVTGEKDAVDEEGKPVYQGVGTGPLDGHFAACINELTALVESLKAEVAALKAAA